MSRFQVFCALSKARIVHGLVGRKVVGSFVCILLCNGPREFLAALIRVPVVLMLVVEYVVDSVPWNPKEDGHYAIRELLSNCVNERITHGILQATHRRPRQ